MAFSGTELLEVAPEANQLATVRRGGDKVLHTSIKRNSASQPPYFSLPFAILDSLTGESLLYTGPTVGPADTAVAQNDALSVWWDKNNSRWCVCSYNRHSSTCGAWVVWISTNGDSGVLYTVPPTDYSIFTGVAVNSDWAVLVKPSGSFFSKRVNLSTGVASDAIIMTSVVELDGSWWVTNGSNLYTYNPATNTSTFIKSLGVGVTTRVVIDGDWFWWLAPYTTTPYVGWNRVTNTVKRIQLTPSSGVPTLNPVQYPAVLDGVIYGVTSDYTKVLAVDIASGKWKYDDLVTARSGRSGVAAANGELWIPSTVTPP